jgi:peptidoglycan/LPS O-acetylase OafA/YrhL
MFTAPATAEFGITTFGGVALFWLAFRANLGLLQKINDRWDISYGTYLYGWPATIFLINRGPHMGPWLLTAAATSISLTLGTLSWVLVEKKAKSLPAVSIWLGRLANVQGLRSDAGHS